TGSATNGLGQGYELDAIASCVVGGVSMRGGVGSVSGVITGALLFQIINYGLVYIGVSPYIQYIVKGAIILIAVAIDTQKYEKKK
ncbi:MAG: beta-methylgalactoside transporter, partial [Ruthenibacterium sp.]